MKKEKPKYGTVPIMLLRDIHKDQNGTIHKMFDYAIYDRMRKNSPMLEHEDFDEMGIQHSMEYLGLEPNNLFSRLEGGRIVYDTFQGAPNASMSIGMLLEFLEVKTEYELMVFSFYCAIRSMIGTKPYLKATDSYWIARAFGYSTTKEYENSNPRQSEKDMRAKYSKRYWLDKIKLTLRHEWYLTYLPTNKHIKIRGFYVSTKMELKELVEVALIANDKYKDKTLADKATIAEVFAKKKQHL
jgi:hypothetical protein